MASLEMRESLERVFNHLVLPPQLPSGQDEGLDKIGHDILRRVRRACGQLNVVTNKRFENAWKTVNAGIAMFQKTDENSRPVPTLLEAFKRLENEGNVVALYIEEQNAGLLMYRHTGNDEASHIVFEAFEASPLSSDVLSAPDALRWTFPSRAVQIPVNDFNATNFQSTLAAFLDQARSEYISHLADKVSKAGRDIAEVRNAANPDLITHMLLSLIQGIGRTAVVEPIKKRVRDDVSFGDGEKPWRRLPAWLILRVFMQRQMSLLLGSSLGYTAYKILSCMILSQLLDDCVKFRLLPVSVSLLQKKLGRKLAKLEGHLSSDNTATPDQKHSEILIHGTARIFKASIEQANRYLEAEILRFKTGSLRKIPHLPLRASNTEQYLSLLNSHARLTRLVSPLAQTEGWLTFSRPIFDPRVYDIDLNDNPAIKSTHEFTQLGLRIARKIQDAQTQSSVLWNKTTLSMMSEDEVTLLCETIPDTISSLMESIPSASPINVETISAFLLEIFDQWTLLDSACVGLYPILKEYRPMFSPDLLNILQLPDFQSMKRLRRIQKYLNIRRNSSTLGAKTIFSEGDMSFNSRFTNSSPTHRALQEKILDEQNRLRKAKTDEWNQDCEIYDGLSWEYDALTCTCTFEDGEWVVAGCHKCFTKRKRNRMKITAHENFLPQSPTDAMAIVFELDVPPCIAAYRNITWKIVTGLAYPVLPVTTSSVVHVRNTRLAHFGELQSDAPISLASDKKTFKGTHYRSVRMKCALTDVLLPLGSAFKLFDSLNKVWIQDLTKPLTLAHLCSIQVPKCLKLTTMESFSHPSRIVTGPSSYEAIASRRECPVGVSVYEFEAFQRLLSGTSRRWLTMLVELGCSNIDFGKEDAVMLFRHLAQQAGPMLPQHGSAKWPYTPTHSETLGTVHAFFKDESFVCRLLNEIEKRLAGIEKNWRETSTMEALITLILRAIELSDNTSICERSKLLLKFIRRTTLAWVDTLRAEIMKAKDGQASKSASIYSFRAALLCRRTFILFSRDTGSDMSAEDLAVFVHASIALQQNLTIGVGSLPQTDRGLFKQDVFMCHMLEAKVRHAMEYHPESIDEAVLAGIGLVSVSGESSSPADTFDSWTFLDGKSSGWISSMLRPSKSDPDQEKLPQHICLHVTQGHLLIDGKTIGKLPDNIRDSPDVKEVFGDRHFVTYPSNMVGMSHRLANPIHGHMIHFGLRESDVVIVSIRESGEVLEYVPRRVFINANNVYDLPRGLVDDCFHWLNRTSGSMEIRRGHSKWHKQRNDWILNVQARKAFRGDEVLVDPHSPTAALISRIFDGFEDTRQLIIFQPTKSRDTLSVELRHLELSFFVNDDMLLECRELGSVVDTNQDAGTLYGYRSMIVLRDVSDPNRRSLITPLGEIEWKRSDIHISVQVKLDFCAPAKGPHSTGRDKAYGRFEIDSNLGRLTCPPEPRLLCTKAQLHAFTSFVVPDPLTGRTGEEEAFHTLLSGRLQPWISLPKGCLLILSQMSKLAPNRVYYPTNLKVLQKVSWDEHLPVGFQNDRYDRIIRAIVSKASRLYRFEENEDEDSKDLGDIYQSWDKILDSDLRTRGEIQRMRYECPRQDIERECPVRILDVEYVSRGCTAEPVSEVRASADCKASTVFQVVTMLHKKSRSVPMSQNISAILDEWKLFGGFLGTPLARLLPISSLVDYQTLQDQWGNILETCCLSEAPDIPLVMFTLAGLAFAPDTNMDAVRLLAACAYLPELRSIVRPTHESYSDFVYRKELTVQMLKNVIETEFVEYVAGDIQAVGRKAVTAALEKERAAHMDICQDEGTRLANAFILQWPDVKAPNIGDFSSSYISVQDALDKVTVLWECLLRNRDLSLYIRDMQQALAASRTFPLPSIATISKSPFRQAPIFIAHKYSVPSLLGELSRQPYRFAIQPLPDLALHHNHNDDRPKERELAQPPEFAELWNIITPFETSTELLRRNYGQDLAASLKALEAAARHDILGEQRALPQILPRRDLEIAMSAYDACLQTTLRHINDCFSEASFLQRQSQVGTGYGWLQSVGLWPRLTPVSILELLRTKETLNLERNMFQALLHYGELLTGCQRIQRLSRALERNDIRRAQDELHNNGHFNWNVADYPDWLLLEIDSNMLIREEQVTVAQAMISPESAQNSVFQLNMGKGKTSMILPMVLSVLADGDQLARLIAPKALLLPTAQVLQSRLGGLVGREVRHVPFSRRLLTQQNCEETFAIFKQHHQDLTRNRGIFIAAPEHILAFKLSSEQCYVDARNMDLAVEMMQFHTHLRNNLCRDVLDESDFTLAVRTQLVYPSGTFTAVDGTPFRWELVQALLSLLEGHVANMADSNPHGINIVKRPGGGFPLVHILHPSVEDDLRSLIAEDIVQGRVLFFRPTPKAANSRLGRFQCGAHNSVSKIQSAIKAALWDDSSDEAVEEAASMFPNPEVIANGLLLMRGLLQHDILATCLKKRWNVQYGLHPKRWPIAVPYEARGVPSERSEFGHPDVTIIFTCLAFYYAGINLEQFRQGLNHVLHHVDDPATEYERWSSGDGVVTLPDDLQHWNSINVDDEGQVETLWEHLRFTRSVINHFLNTFVFPLYSRQFSVKLQASAWDLPIFTQNQSTTESSASRAKTTGFSGTNDNKSMLPLTIKQQDLPGLQQTNAEVLSYLLQQRNRNYICTGQQGKTRWTEEELVRSLAGYRIQVFIDAGAYILEKTNISLARAWLALTEPSIKAAVFFDEKDNRAWVIFRDTTAPKAPLVSTPFAERLDECIVYYDEAHTRGVDLQLPPEARGALTLALGQTKDHTVQAAMRLRQLGTTQSVVFYAPPEVDQSIRDLCQLGNSVTKSFVNSSHVVRWLLEQTCQANEQLGSLYASHGLDFCRRTEATWKYQDTLDNPQSRKSLLDVLEQPERQTLKVMYGHAQPASTNNRGNRRQKPDRRKAKGKDESPKAAPLKQFMDQLQEYRSAGTASGVVRKGTFEEVEQEREVEVQVEQQRDTRPRKKYAALKFPGSVCKAICKFVETGVLSGDVGYQSAYAFIAGTDIGKRHNVHEIKSRLFVTAEFQRTIEGIFSGKSPRDDFLRPVEWLLWSPSTETGIVIIPEELELLIPDIHKSPFVHLVAYAAPVTRTMLDFSSLTYYSFPAMPVGYTMPAWLPVEMGILSGRLYMEFKEAMHMAQYIGQAVNVDADEETSVTEPFCANPTTFLLEWLPLRRAAKDILHTPAAYVCQGRALRPDHAFFSQSTQYQQEEKKDQTKLPKIEEVGIISPDIDFLNDGIDGLGIEVNEESSPTTEELSGNSSGTNSISDGIDELVIEVTEEEEEEIVIVRKVMVS